MLVALVETDFPLCVAFRLLLLDWEAIVQSEVTALYIGTSCSAFQARRMENKAIWRCTVDILLYTIGNRNALYWFTLSSTIIAQ